MNGVPTFVANSTGSFYRSTMYCTDILEKSITSHRSYNCKLKETVLV